MSSFLLFDSLYSIVFCSCLMGATFPLFNLRILTLVGFLKFSSDPHISLCLSQSFSPLSLFWSLILMLGDIPQMSGSLWLSAPIHSKLIKIWLEDLYAKGESFTVESGHRPAALWGLPNIRHWAISPMTSLLILLGEGRLCLTAGTVGDAQPTPRGVDTWADYERLIT